MQSLLKATARGVQLSASRARSIRCMASAAAPPPKYSILEYKYVADILEKRTPYREAHLAAAKAKAVEGKLLMVGAVGETPEGAVFIWQGASKEEITAYVAEDPYIKAGLVPSWTIKPYNVVDLLPK